MPLYPPLLLIVSDTGPFWLQGHRTTQSAHCAMVVKIQFVCRTPAVMMTWRWLRWPQWRLTMMRMRTMRTTLVLPKDFRSKMSQISGILWKKDEKALQRYKTIMTYPQSPAERKEMRNWVFARIKRYDFDLWMMWGPWCEVGPIWSLRFLLCGLLARDTP